MEISASILSIPDDIKNNIEHLDKTNIDYLHLDIMDGNFVPVKTWNIDEMKDMLTNTSKPYDVHLMVKDVKEYVDSFSKLNPLYITFHSEAVDDILNTIYYIKSKGIKVGISIKPNTPVENIYKYLNKVDLVLIMSVEPGYGGQKFLLPSISKINKLYDYRKKYNFHYKIEVDGGINNNTIVLVKNSDIVVVGSYITKNNYEESINNLKGSLLTK